MGGQFRGILYKYESRCPGSKGTATSMQYLRVTTLHRYINGAVKLLKEMSEVIYAGVRVPLHRCLPVSLHE